MEALNDAFAQALTELRNEQVFNSFGEIRIIENSGQKRPFVLGQQTVENTPFSVKQLIAVLCAVEKNTSEYMNIIERPRFENEPKWVDKIVNFEQAIKDKILSGLKILDLGCGERPFFSYIVRMLGAEVYTADVIPASNFESMDHKEHADPIAEQFHIRCNLDNDNALEIIEQKSGGKFNFVTEAHLDTGTPREDLDGSDMDAASNKGKYLAKKLLIPNGLYYNGEYRHIDHESQL